MNLEGIRSKFNELVHQLTAVYETLADIVNFFSAIVAWFGFYPLLALISIFFFHRVLQSLGAAERRINLFLASLLFVFLWFAWNLNYHGSYNLWLLIKTYSFLGAHVVAVWLLQKLLQAGLQQLKSAFSRAKPQDLWEEHKALDQAVSQAREELHEGNLKEAAQKLRPLVKRWGEE